MLQIDITFRFFSGDMVFMTAKINVHQYVIFMKSQNFGIQHILSVKQ